MSSNAEIEKDQYEKINDLRTSVDQLRGSVDVANQINIEHMKLLKKALSYEFHLILFLIAALVYGAIGKDGLFAVRQAVPIPTYPTDQPSDQQTMIIPWHNDLEKYYKRTSAA